jgi:transcriptional antiterminator RfaH
MNWVTLYSKPNMERRVSEALEDKGVATYLPIVYQYSTHRRRKEPSPFFPCYLFARIDAHSPEWPTLQWIPGLRSIVRFDNTPAPVPDCVITQLQESLRRLDGGGYFADSNRFRPGERVLITGEPLKDLRAVFDRGVSKQGRVRILLEFLGRLTACEVESDWLVEAS